MHISEPTRDHAGSVHRLQSDRDQFALAWADAECQLIEEDRQSEAARDLIRNMRQVSIAALIILAAAQFHSLNAAIFFLIFISLTANATHSILGTAAAMDIGGAKMAGSASGVIDSFQYFGGSLAGYFLGALLDRSWGNYFYFMAPFGLIGGLLMLSILGRVTLAKSAR